MIPDYTTIHNQFKINGFHLDHEGLFQTAYSFIKEGDVHEREFGAFLLDWIDAMPTLQVKTSGTTGLPKLITLQKQAMVHSALATAEFFDLKPGTNVLHCLPTRYIAGKMMLVRALVLGLELDIITPTSDLKGLQSSKKYEFVALVPAQAQASSDKLNQFKKIIIGGAQLPEGLTKQLENCQAMIYETYGMTETITHIAAKKIGAAAFKTLPNVTVSQDDRGCLVIHAPTIAAENIVTNDLVELLSEIEFKWLGRIDHVINSGGIKYFPEEIEAKLRGQISQRFFIASLPDPVLGQKIIMCIEGPEFPFETNIFNVLDHYERPKKVYYIPAFIETNSKLKRFEMVAQIVNSL